MHRAGENLQVILVNDFGKKTDYDGEQRAASYVSQMIELPFRSRSDIPLSADRLVSENQRPHGPTEAQYGRSPRSIVEGADFCLRPARFPTRNFFRLVSTFSLAAQLGTGHPR